MNLSWIPNGLSLGNLFLGFLSIIASAKGSATGDHSYFIYSTIFILIAGLFDVLDGRIARKINRPNPIGKELDSFADLITFGLAPGFMFFVMLYGKEPLYPSPVHYIIGAFIAFLFPLFTSLRLAMFNIAEPSNYFTGIPSTVAGCSIALILSFDLLPVPLIPYLSNFKIYFPWWAIVILFIFYSVLMVSKFRFPKLPSKLASWAKGNDRLRNVLGILTIIVIVLLFKFFLLITTIFYTLKPIITYRKKIPAP